MRLNRKLFVCFYWYRRNARLDPVQGRERSSPEIDWQEPGTGISRWRWLDVVPGGWLTDLARTVNIDSGVESCAAVAHTAHVWLCHIATAQAHCSRNIYSSSYTTSSSSTLYTFCLLIGRQVQSLMDWISRLFYIIYPRVPSLETENLIKLRLCR